MPTDVGLRFDFKHGAFDVDVMSLTGTHKGAVRSKDHGRVVIILGLVSDLDSLHESLFVKSFRYWVIDFPSLPSKQSVRRLQLILKLRQA
jgi:hypothetical protein